MLYTSGPWEVRVWKGDEWPEKRVSIAGENRAIVISPRYEDDNFMNNAHLISAAPDLLESLQELRGQAMSILKGKPARCFDETIAKVDKAINKALGDD